MKTNKQNKTNSKNSSELKNRTEQLSENTPATAKTPEPAPEKAETATQNAPVKPYVNFAERDHNRTLSVEKVLEKLKRWFPAQYELAEVVGKWVWITFPEPPIERKCGRYQGVVKIAQTATASRATQKRSNAGKLRCRCSPGGRGSPASPTRVPSLLFGYEPLVAAFFFDVTCLNC